MPDNLIQVGAVVDLGQYKAGMAEAVATTERTTQQMSVAMERHAAVSREAVGGIKLAFEDAGISLNRHVARWLAAAPVLAAAAEAAFPAFAIISFADSIFKASDKLDSYTEKVRKSVLESLDLALSFDKQAESVEISNLKIQDHIATLERRPKQNGIAIAAMEGKRALEELIKSFQDAINKENELLTGQEQGFFNKLLYGDSGINDILSKAVEFQSGIDETLTKLRLAEAQKNKTQTEEFKAELATRLAAYSTFLNQQIERNEKGRAKEITDLHNQTAQIEADYTKQFTAAQKLAAAKAYQTEELAAQKDINQQYDKTDQTLRSLLILVTNFGKTQVEITKHGGLLGAESAAEELRKFEDILDKAGQDIRHMAEAADKDQVTAAEKTTKEILTLTEKQNVEIIKAADKQLAAWDELYKGQIDAAKSASEIKIQRITQDFERGKINQQQEIALIAKAKQSEIALEIQFHQARQDLWAGDLKKVQEIENAIAKAQAQSELIAAKAQTESLKVRQQNFDRYFQQVSGTFNAALNSWIDKTQTAAQAFGKMFDGIIIDLVGFVEKWIEKKIEMWLRDEIIGKTAQISQTVAHNAANAVMAQSDAFLAAANALATVPFPENIPASTAMLGLGTSFAISAASFDIGTNFVPMDGLAKLHRGEQIIPANQQGPGYSGSGHLHVHFDVSAIDADGVRGHLRKNRKQYADMFFAEAKKRGFGK